MNTTNHWIDLNGDVLGSVCEFKYLGMWLDSDLKFEKHVTDTCNKVEAKLELIRKLRYVLNLEGAVSVCEQALVPVLEYGDFLVDSAPSGPVKRLQTLQNHGLRI